MLEQHRQKIIKNTCEPSSFLLTKLRMLFCNLRPIPMLYHTILHDIYYSVYTNIIVILSREIFGGWHDYQCTVI